MQLFNYYHQLQTRKLQYIGAMFTAAGVFFAVWKDVAKSEFAEPFCLGATFTFMVLLQMFSRIRRHVHRVSREVNRLCRKEVLELPTPYCAGLQGITLYLYVLTIIFASTWLFIFWNLNVVAARALVAIFLLQIINLNLVYSGHGEVSLLLLLHKCIERLTRRPTPVASPGAPSTLLSAPIPKPPGRLEIFPRGHPKSRGEG